MTRGLKAGAIAIRSRICVSPSFRISVCAWKARFIGVFGSSELNSSGLSFTYLVSSALVSMVRPVALTRITGASLRSRW